jgi:hypothetical protein
MSSSLKEDGDTLVGRGESTGMVEAFKMGGNSGEEILPECPSMR